MTSTIPTAPDGYIHAGPVSDFLPTTSPSSSASETNGDSGTDNPNDQGTTSVCSAVSAPATTATTTTATEALKASCKTQGEEGQLIKVIEISQPAGRYPPVKRVAVSFFHNKWYAFINICPHQGSALSKGTMTDIEDMGIVWGAGVTCSLHNWTFDASSGQSDSTRFVIDTHDVKEIDGHVFISQKPKNAHIAGQRRDFGGREMN
ncbi:hypothetical protein EC957_003311 [Mortierella hygrophila]|uniref:Rieske domain-containing protein n=1 Tax=Mortierella hygrophila TaxID=979708 RepID=A0A9P6F3D4_9FUNG|nr:hypothetical protein EC957_003311 [Mortierella hygrophila]